MSCSTSFLRRALVQQGSCATLSCTPLSSLFARRAFSILPSMRNSTMSGSCKCGCGGSVRLCTRAGYLQTSVRTYCTDKKETESAANAGKEGDKATEATTPEDEIKQMKSQLLYALADAENARRIAAEDIKKARDFSVKDFAKDMCDVMDALDRATLELSKISSDDQARLKPITQGIELTRNILVHNLERHGVRKIKSDIGSVFDCNVHEALFNHTIKEGEKLEAGQIAAVVKTGYMIHQRVLRAAQVGVAQKADV